MLHLSKSKLEKLLKNNGLNIANLAKESGVSRQSIYNMFSKSSVFNTAFEKMINFLGVPFNEITDETDPAVVIVKNFPEKIKKIVVWLENFCAENKADLILFGSRVAGKTGLRHDFDFAVYFHNKHNVKGLKVLKKRVEENAFPYRVDLVDMNTAPEWFKESMGNDMAYLRREKKK